MIEVPYRSAAQMAQDAASGSGAGADRIDRRIQRHGAGRQTPLPRASVRPSASRPCRDIPTMNETVPGVTMDGWFVLVAPAGMPADIVQRMNHEMGIEFARRDIQDRIVGFGACHNRRRDAGEHRRIHRPRAGQVARTGAGARHPAAIGSEPTWLAIRRWRRWLCIFQDRCGSTCRTSRRRWGQPPRPPAAGERPTQDRAGYPRSPCSILP